MIEVKNLTKKYGSHLAVDDLSFTIEKGQIYGFLGPNGAGKSTTMNIMTGYIGATSGEVFINGVNILEDPERAKSHIGYLPEIPPLYLDMTVKEYLSFVSELKKIPKNQRENAIQQVSDMIKLDEVTDRLIRNLSKGYKQRVGLAAAILGFPEIIILDEPTVGLDPKQILEIRQLIRTLAKDHTVILSSHILAEVQEICDYVLIISKGKLVASDTPDRLEELSGGQESIELTIHAPQPQIETILASIDGIQSITCSSTSEEFCDVIAEISGDSQKLCEDISLAFAAKKIPITRIYVSKATLEDIFLELTQNSPEDDKTEPKGGTNHERHL